MLEQAAASPDREICGLLLGEGSRVSELVPAANVADDPSQRFEIDPMVLLRAHREARRGGGQVLGHYHSHPSGVAEPSRCDAELAHADNALWLLCTPGGDYALWRADGRGLHDQFTQMDLHPE